MNKSHSSIESAAQGWPSVGQLLADSRPSVGRQLGNSRPTVGQQSADCWPQSADCWPAVGRLLPNCRPTVGQLLADSRPTVNFGNYSSLLPTQEQSKLTWHLCVSASSYHNTYSLVMKICSRKINANWVKVK